MGDTTDEVIKDIKRNSEAIGKMVKGMEETQIEHMEKNVAIIKLKIIDSDIVTLGNKAKLYGALNDDDQSALAKLISNRNTLRKRLYPLRWNLFWRWLS